MTDTREFQPDWASPPGDTISDLLKERSLSTVEFAELIGQTPEEVDYLLLGRSTITLGTARQLERVLGASVEFRIAGVVCREFDEIAISQVNILSLELAFPKDLGIACKDIRWGGCSSKVCEPVLQHLCDALPEFRLCHLLVFAY